MNEISGYKLRPMDNEWTKQIFSELLLAKQTINRLEKDLQT
jgi:hypothetical protein